MVGQQRRPPPVVRDALATGTAVTHEALDELAASHRVEHLRRRLIAAGSLPERHHQLSLFDRWLRAFLPTISDDQHRQAISAYAVWHHRRRLAAQVDAGTMRVSAPRASRRHSRAATRFLEFLAHRQRSLAGCRQVDIDDWLAGGPTTRRSAINFVTWARTGGLCPRHLAVPDYAHRVPDEMPRAERSALIGRLLHDPDIVLRDRVAGLLVAVYAQPVTRVTQLRRRHVLDLDGTTGVCLGVDVVELEDVIATHVGRLAAGVDDPDGWLFPGRTPGQAVSAHLLAERLHALGVTRAARCGALHELVTHVPSPLLAGLLGYNPVVIALRAEALATSWHTYTAVAAAPAQDAGQLAPASAIDAEAADHEPAPAEAIDALG